MQQDLPVCSANRARADCHEAAVGWCARRWAEWRQSAVVIGVPRPDWRRTVDRFHITWAGSYDPLRSFDEVGVVDAQQWIAVIQAEDLDLPEGALNSEKQD